MAYAVRFDWPAEITRDWLKGQERADLESMLDLLRDGSFEASPRVYPATEGRGADPRFIGEVNDDLRMLFKVDGDQIEVLFIASQAFAEQIAGHG